MNKNFIDLTDYDKETLLKIIERAVELKNGAAPISGRDKVLAMIFNKPSTRTNVSFQMAMHRLGGRAIYLGSEAMQLSRGESISDTARTLSRYVDAIMIRTYAHSDVEELAEVASVPVINGLTDLLHPCQALADVMSFMEKKGDNFSELKMTYVGDGNNVCN
ncbi:MAG: ornithine carbamoyltransferase, partial [Elusimicrobia bacterium]|nr:ornithine carbamoyltransferase [Elusimicrobiota bacterium]